jgi:penicillin-binding protein 1A
VNFIGPLKKTHYSQMKNSYLSKESISPRTRKMLKWFWMSFAGLILFIILFFVAIYNGWIGYMPPLSELQNPRNHYASEIYSSDMKLLGNFSLSKGNRMSESYLNFSPYLVNALVATEDVRFYDHSGIDGWALVRAGILRGLFQVKSAGGASTLTQQLAKQLYSPRTRNFFTRLLQKPIEWVIAIKLERLYTKEEIINMYLNQFDFLNNAVGIKSAAQIYFNVTPDKLTIEQAATLVGMCKNPSYYNPLRFNERTRGRRNTVLIQMYKADMLTRPQLDSLSKLPLELNYHRADFKEGPAPYFREFLRRIMTAEKPVKSDYADWQKQQYIDDSIAWTTNPLYGFCNKHTKADGTPYNIYTDGLRIYTTIDSRMQHYAEEAVHEQMTSLQDKFFKEKRGRSYAPFSKLLSKDDIDDIMNRSMKLSDRYRNMKKAGATPAAITKAFNTKVPMQVYSYRGQIDTVMTPLDSIKYIKYFLRCGFMSMDPNNGHVKAYVGGPDFNMFQYDMATVGRRQVGSTIKPFLYSLAMEEGFWPCSPMLNEPITLDLGNGETWTPRNSNTNRQGETVTLKWGIAQSNNWITARLMSNFTPQAMVKMMRSFGIKGYIPPVWSLCVGPAEVSLLEMVDAYTAFPNKGIRVDPMYVTRIEDSNGNVIASFEPKMTEILSELTSYKMLTLLRGVVDGGTASRLRYAYHFSGQLGGKTGTTQNNSDGWFIGFTPSLISGVWVGGEERAVHFDFTSDGQGASMALPIWAIFMHKVYSDATLGYSESEAFKIPSTFNPDAGCDGSVPDDTSPGGATTEEF